MSYPIPETLRQAVRAEAGGCCAYCHSPEAFIGLPFEIDHIYPISHGGQTVSDNLCLCCRSCNVHKGKRVTAVDPETGRRVRLFHPHQHRWSEHFAWNQDGTVIIGLTAIGRATVAALKMNHDLIVPLRVFWRHVGLNLSGD